MNISIRPIVSEKANAISEKLGRYTFRVSPDATKGQIKALVEELYDVKVVRVNTCKYDGKRKARGTKRGYVVGRTPAFKKAVVSLAEGQTIDFYSNI
ncbi:MAG: 50S ribosomal protein L23 [Muribaculaceae bacterium]|nr:50S ribosomal protein L23 [Muribaculaceae bacterium]